MVISSTHFSEEPSSASEILDDIEEMADSEISSKFVTIPQEGIQH